MLCHPERSETESKDLSGQQRTERRASEPLDPSTPFHSAQDDKEEVPIDTIAHDPATNVALRTITRDNFRAVIRLQLDPGQERFVADNVFSLAEACVEPSFQPLAIYHGDTLVGFCMFGYEDPPGRWWIIRLMIAAGQQGRGYGRAAMQLLIRVMVERHQPRQIVTSYEPDNDVAAGLYRSLGFRDTGDMDEGELVVILDLPGQPASTNAAGTVKDGTNA